MRLHVSGCRRYVAIILIRDDRENKYDLPDALRKEQQALANSSNTENIIRWAFKVIQFFHPNPTGGSLEEIIETYKNNHMFSVWDIKQDTFENAHVYESNGYKENFGNPIDLYRRTSNIDLSTCWNTILRPMWRGDVPSIERELIDINGNKGMYKFKYYICKNKRFYILVLEEKEEVNAITELLNTPLEEEAPPATDYRQTIHTTIRFFRRYPTEPHDPRKMNLFLMKMKMKFGEETDSLSYIIVDYHIEDVTTAHVYRSQAHIFRYGPLKDLLHKLLKPLTMKRAMDFVVSLFKNNDVVNVQKMRTQKGDEVDTLEIQFMKENRYLGFAFKISSTIPYVEPDTQSWFSGFFG